MKTALSTALALLLTATTLAGGDVDSDRKRLEGVWVGRLGPLPEMEVIFSNNQWTIKIVGRDQLASGVFTLSSPQGRPKELNLKIDKQTIDPEKAVGKTALAIFEIRGDVLRVCLNETGKNERPRVFEMKGSFHFGEFRRVK